MLHHCIDGFRRRAYDLGETPGISNLLDDPVLNHRGIVSFVRCLGLKGEEPAPITPDDVRNTYLHKL